VSSTGAHDHDHDHDVRRASSVHDMTLGDDLYPLRGKPGYGIHQSRPRHESLVFMCHVDTLTHGVA